MPHWVRGVSINMGHGEVNDDVNSVVGEGTDFSLLGVGNPPLLTMG